MTLGKKSRQQSITRNTIAKMLVLKKILKSDPSATSVNAAKTKPVMAIVAALSITASR